MTDIVERLQRHISLNELDEDDQVALVPRWEVDEATDEIKSLRQRVAGLEKDAERAGALVLNINADKLRLEKELAALKQSQGEPVAWLGADGDVHLFWEDESDKPLYTSAPTIPEGWQFVPKEPTPAMIGDGCLADISPKPQWTRIKDIWIYMLSAAPKPEDVK